ncbi:MAG: VOC family protein [Planctomycetaceae bacterium]|nr:VOC family protein [Planctomycetaceae bacterium]
MPSIEHLALNVPDSAAMADWYVRHLEMRILRSGGPPHHGRFLADEAGRCVLELYSRPDDGIPDYAALHPMTLHVAFNCLDVAAAFKALTAAGAVVVDAPTTDADGNTFAMLRDPWGVAVQLVRRAKSLLPELPVWKHTTSFRYDKFHTKEWYATWFERLAADYGLALVDDSAQTRNIFTPEDLETALPELGSPQSIEELHRLGLAPLEQKKIDQLCRPITFRTRVYHSKGGVVTLEVRAAQGNEFPAIGIELWWEEELRLFGGFIDLKVRGDRKVFDQIKTFLSIRA